MNFFNTIYDVLGVFFGPIMSAIYELVNNYGLAIIVFTLVFRTLMLPIPLKQHRNMAKSYRMQMKTRKIKEKYKGDMKRQQQETQELYRREGFNPTA
jgi:YidC/Oxa1 family membrane protein insertase